MSEALRQDEGRTLAVPQFAKKNGNRLLIGRHVNSPETCRLDARLPHCGMYGVTFRTRGLRIRRKHLKL